jgi:hypothetical protein
MNKKIGILVVLLLVFSVTGAFSFGIGIQGGWDNTMPANFAITFKQNNSPLTFAGNYYLDPGNYFALGLTVDYWLFNPQITNWLRWYVGVGAGASVGFGDEFSFGIAGRVPIGLNAFFLNDVLEPYIQVVPKIGVGFVPTISFAPIGVEATAGLRVWFK